MQIKEAVKGDGPVLPRQDCCESVELFSRNAVTGLNLNFRIKQEEVSSQSQMQSTAAHPNLTIYECFLVLSRVRE